MGTTAAVVNLRDRGYLRRVDSHWRAIQQVRVAVVTEALRQLREAVGR